MVGKPREVVRWRAGRARKGFRGSSASRKESKRVCVGFAGLIGCSCEQTDVLKLNELMVQKRYASGVAKSFAAELLSNAPLLRTCRE